MDKKNKQTKLEQNWGLKIATLLTMKLLSNIIVYAAIKTKFCTVAVWLWFSKLGLLEKLNTFLLICSLFPGLWFGHCGEINVSRSRG